jgi:hypothetical protein
VGRASCASSSASEILEERQANGHEQHVTHVGSLAGPPKGAPRRAWLVMPEHLGFKPDANAEVSFAKLLDTEHK